MHDLLKAEVYKLIKNKLFLGMMVYLFLIAFFLPLLSLRDISCISGKYVLLRFSSNFSKMFFLVTLVYSMTIINEFYTGYIKDAITFGHNKKSIIFSKMFGFLLGSVILNVWYIFTTTMVAIYVNGYGVPIDRAEISYILRTFFFEVLVIIGMSSITFLVAVVTKKIHLTAFLMIAIYTAMEFIGGVDHEKIYQMYQYTIYGQRNLAFLQSLNPMQMLRLCVVSILTLGIMAIGSMKAFEKMKIE